MRIQVVAVGRLKAGPERDLAERYRSRAAALARGLGFAGPDIAELPESRQRRPDERRAEEDKIIRQRAGTSRLAVLDEAGPSIGSVAFADHLVGLRDAGGDLAFAIGGPDGLSPDILRDSHLTVSFGRLTLPHQLVRVLLLEQVYRAFTIIAGHPYHRAGAESR